MSTKTELKNGTKPPRNEFTREQIEAIIDQHGKDEGKGREALPETFFDFCRWAERGAVTLEEKRTNAKKGDEKHDDAYELVDRMAKAIAKETNHAKTWNEKTKKTKRSQFRAAVKLGQIVVDGEHIGVDLLTRAKATIAEYDDAKSPFPAYIAVASAQNSADEGTLIDEDTLTKACRKAPDAGIPTVLEIWEGFLGDLDKLFQITPKGKTKPVMRADKVKDDSPEGTAVRNAVLRHVVKLRVAENNRLRDLAAKEDAETLAQMEAEKPAPRARAKK